MRKFISLYLALVILCGMTIPVLAVDLTFEDPWEVTDHSEILSEDTKQYMLTESKKLSEVTHANIAVYTDNIVTDDYQAVAKDIYKALMPQAKQQDRGVVIVYSEEPRGLGVAYGKDIRDFMMSQDEDIFNQAVDTIKLGQSDEALKSMFTAYANLLYSQYTETIVDVEAAAPSITFDAMTPEEQAKSYLNKGAIQNEQIYSQLKALLPSLSPEQQKEVLAYLETYDGDSGYRNIYLVTVIAVSLFVAVVLGFWYIILHRKYRREETAFKHIQQWYKRVIQSIERIDVIDATVRIRDKDNMTYVFLSQGDTLLLDATMMSNRYKELAALSILYLFASNHRTDIMENAWVFYKSRRLLILDRMHLTEGVIFNDSTIRETDTTEDTFSDSI